MKKNITMRRMVCCLFFALLWQYGAVYADSGEEAEKPASINISVAVVDVRTVMAGSDRWARFEREHRMRSETIREILQDYQNRQAMLEMEYESLPPGTDRAFAKRSELQEFLQEYERRERELTREWHLFLIEGHSSFYESLQRVIADYAASNDIDLVLKKQQPDFTISDRGEAELRKEVDEFAASDVLYAAAGLDISSEIIKHLNMKTEEPDTEGEM